MGLLLVAKRKAARPEPSLDESLAYSIRLRERLRGFSREITLDAVVKIEVRSFSGHIYNLETAEGWFACNSIITHNCRHTLDLYVPGITRPREKASYEPEAYEALQKQRYMERGVRRWKRREAVAITPEEQRLTKAKRKEWQAGLRGHIKAANLAGEAEHGAGWIELRRDYTREKA